MWSVCPDEDHDNKPGLSDTTSTIQWYNVYVGRNPGVFRGPYVLIFHMSTHAHGPPNRFPVQGNMHSISGAQSEGFSTRKAAVERFGILLDNGLVERRAKIMTHIQKLTRADYPSFFPQPEVPIPLG